MCALEGKKPEIGEQAVLKLLDVLDNVFEIPERDTNSEPMFAVEHVYSIQGDSYFFSCFLFAVKHLGAQNCILRLYFVIILIMPGRGTVVTGKLERGTLKKGDKVEVVGHDRDSVKSIITGFPLFTFFSLTFSAIEI